MLPLDVQNIIEEKISRGKTVKISKDRNNQYHLQEEVVKKIQIKIADNNTQS